MNNQSSVIYQSGQTVVVTGMYEVVGINRNAKVKTGEFVLRSLYAGEKFPCFEGREVAWHVLENAAENLLVGSKLESAVASRN